MNSRRFTQRNEAFTCAVCGEQVPASSFTCRNHCPFCLHSVHLDELPGDRLSSCHGILVPIGYYQHSRKGTMIQFQCRKCGAKRVNKAALEDTAQPDDFDKILALPGIG